jgi:hypothetical protein
MTYATLIVQADADEDGKARFRASRSGCSAV